MDVEVVAPAPESVRVEAGVARAALIEAVGPRLCRSYVVVDHDAGSRVVVRASCTTAPGERHADMSPVVRRKRRVDVRRPIAPELSGTEIGEVGGPEINSADVGERVGTILLRVEGPPQHGVAG